MDEIDFTISMMLMANSRISYSTLAKTFDMSVNSIYKRIKSMVDLGIIQGFKTKLSFLNFPETTNVLLFGRSPVKDKKSLMEKIGSHECVYNVTQASGELFYIHAYTRNLRDLNSIISILRNEGDMRNPTVGLDKNSPSSLIDGPIEQIQYTATDYLIINSLEGNSRKTISDIAEEVGVSTKTVTRRLNRLIDKKLIDFTIDWYPDKTSEILSFIVVKSKPDKDLEDIEIKEKVNSKYGFKVFFEWRFVNLPSLMVVGAWVGSMKELQDIEYFLNEQDLESVEVTLLIEGKMYPTWVNTYLEEKVKKIREEGSKTG